MAARSTRQEARARILSAFAAQLDRVIPEDQSVPLKGATFADFEDQVEALAQAALPVVLEERAALESNARVGDRRAMPALWFGGCVPGEGGDPAGGAVTLRAGGLTQTARPVPLLWRFFFPLRFVIGDCLARYR